MHPINISDRTVGLQTTKAHLNFSSRLSGLQVIFQRCGCFEREVCVGDYQVHAVGTAADFAAVVAVAQALAIVSDINVPGMDCEMRCLG